MGTTDGAPTESSSSAASDDGISTSAGATASTLPTTSSTDSSGNADESGGSTAATGGVDIPAQAWTDGAAPPRVIGPDLLDLPGGLEGPPLWVSNNPERVFGPGWLFQHARTDPQRGGAATPLDAFVAYAFHLNATRQPLTFHWIATNPAGSPVTLSARGSLYNNSQHPIGVGSGPSVAVARDVLTDAASIDLTTEIEPGQGVELGRLVMPPGAVLDGRIEISASEGIYLYMVATPDGSTATAINLSQGEPGPGEILEPGPNAFGRMAGIYEHGTWAGSFDTDVPPPPAHVGLALNTSDKFQLDGASLQSQTAAALVNLSDSSDESFGNYGMRYALQIRLCAADAQRTVAIRFGSNFTADSDTPSFTWNGPARVDGEIVDIYTTPTSPSVELAQRVIAPDTCIDVALELVVPGLITGGQQLVLESR